jgi:hypothetical protein
MTTTNEPQADGARKTRVMRRRFLGGMGASGLAAAGVIFGRAPAAYAEVDVDCCHLCGSPSISLSTCRGYSKHYVWECEKNSSVYCLCCETGTTSASCPSGVKSAIACYLN